MTGGATVDALALQQWLDALDQLSYYELFRLSPTATFDELRAAFHAFAETFHPDVHGFRPPGEQAAIGHIFRRGTEAYRVLVDPALRARYDEALASGILRPESLVIEADPGARSVPPGPVGGRLVDRVKNPGPRPFVLRAEELMKKGDPRQAKIQLVMAMHLEPRNPALEALAQELDDAVKKKSDEDKRTWSKG